jgi:hypothetical protein
MSQKNGIVEHTAVKTPKLARIINPKKGSRCVALSCSDILVVDR